MKPAQKKTQQISVSDMPRPRAVVREIRLASSRRAAPRSAFYLTSRGTLDGPYSRDQIRAYLKTGLLARDTLYCRVGGDLWVPVAELKKSVTEAAAPAEDRAVVKVGIANTTPSLAGTRVLADFEQRVSQIHEADRVAAVTIATNYIGAVRQLGQDAHDRSDNTTMEAASIEVRRFSRTGMLNETDIVSRPAELRSLQKRWFTDTWQRVAETSRALRTAGDAAEAELRAQETARAATGDKAGAEILRQYWNAVNTHPALVSARTVEEDSRDAWKLPLDWWRALTRLFVSSGAS